MVLELKEYTMASLGYKSSENPLISANQTRPSPFTIKTTDSLLSYLSSSSFSSPPPRVFRRPKGAATPTTPSQIHCLFLLPSTTTE